MPSASSGLELPATSLIAPLLLAIPRLPRARSKLRHRVEDQAVHQKRQKSDTSRPSGWQYESVACPRANAETLCANKTALDAFPPFARDRPVPLLQRDRVDVASIVGLGPMGRAAKTEE